MGKLLSARKIAEMLGVDRKIVENMCHARGQRFAFRITPRGKYYIDLDKFMDHIERKIRA